MEITKKHNSAHPTRSGRNGNIDLMRFVFCLIIILYHINNRLDLNPPFGLSEKYFSFCGEGRIGVEFFLCRFGLFACRYGKEKLFDKQHCRLDKILYVSQNDVDFSVSYVWLHCRRGTLVSFLQHAEYKGGN